MKTLVIAGALLFASPAAWAQAPAPPVPAPPGPAPPAMAPNIRMGLGVQGEIAFNRVCTACHVPQGDKSADSRAPFQETLRQFPPERIYAALTTGKMQAQGAALTDLEQRQVSAWLSGRELGAASGDAKTMPNACKSIAPTAPSAFSWNGWSPGLGNARFQTAKAAGLTPTDIPRLKLKWAFGLPGGVETSSQPSVVRGTVYVGSDSGNVYAIDARTGCVHWSFLAGAGVRDAPVLTTAGKRREVVFGDLTANLYAVDAGTGALIWKNRIADQPLSRITGAATIYAGKIYVGVSSSEEISGLQANYECCRMRGSVNSIDAVTGKTVWKFYTIAKPAAVIGTRPDGRKKWGPAGIGVWSAPSVDPKRGVIYIATGDSFTEPAEPLSDSIVALSMKTGKKVWSYQATPGDAYMTGCNRTGPNCPATNGPDYDFGSSAVLQTLADGRQVIVGGHKGGGVILLDPDRKGALVWSTMLATQMASAKGDIVFGGAVDRTAGYYAMQITGGLASIDLKTGKERWFTPSKPPADRAARIGSAAAVSVIPGVVFNGGWDGVVRAFDTRDGHELWSYDTVHAFDTVNKVEAKGGSMGAPGVTVADGMIFVGSGYIGTSNGMPGNVILAFAAE